MSKMQDWLLRAAKELGVRVELGVEIQLPGGRHVCPQAYFPDFGAPNGLLVFRWQDGLAQATEEARFARATLAEKGFTISTFGEPGVNEVFDIGTYVEMFSDWGWSGSDDTKPTWMKQS